MQGGGCMTVGVAGLVQSGGFGSLSKAFGSAASSLLEAEVVTADGRIRIVNAANDPELFWALKGGGGGSFGIVIRLTLRTHALPATVGAANFQVQANSDTAWRTLVARTIDLYAEKLFNPHWGEQILFRSRRRLQFAMVSQGLDEAAHQAAMRSFLDWIAAHPADYVVADAPFLRTLPARSFWNPAFLKKVPGVVIADDRPGAAPENVFWSGNRSEAGQVLHAYHSAWLPARLLGERARLVDALVEASSHWQVSLHCNKGLAGAPPEAVAATRDTATNPQVLDAFALLICASEEPPAYPGVPGHEPNVREGREEAAAIAKAMEAIDRLAPGAGSYVSESDYFEKDWARSFWGTNSSRLRAAKQRYDPEGLFFVHHGVGSEAWSADGFTRIA